MYIAIWVRLEGSGIHHTLIIHQLMLLDLVGCLDGKLFGITDNVMGLGDVGLVRPLFQGILDIIQDVSMAQNLVIELSGPFTVQGQTMHLTFLFAFVCQVAIILPPSGGKLHDEVTPAKQE